MREIEEQIFQITMELTQESIEPPELARLSVQLSEVYASLLAKNQSNPQVDEFLEQIQALSTIIEEKGRLRRAPESARLTAETHPSTAAGHASSSGFFATSARILTIGITGLADIPKKSWSFVIAIFNKLLEQIPREYQIKLIAYKSRDRKDKTLDNINAVLSNRAFLHADKIDPDIAFEGFLDADNYRNNNFILNFAGDEIKDAALIAHQGLYYADLDPKLSEESRRVFIDNLKIAQSGAALYLPSFVTYQDSRPKVVTRSRVASTAAADDAGPAGAGAPAPTTISAEEREIYRSISASFNRIDGLLDEYHRLNTSKRRTERDTMRLSVLETDVLKVIPAPVHEEQVGELSATLPKLLLNSPSKQDMIAGVIDPKFPGKRQVRGDGNCYYRALMYAYLEQVLLMDEDAKMIKLDKLIGKLEGLVGKFGHGYDSDIINLITIIHQIKSNATTENLSAMLEHNAHLDHLLVRAARALTAEHLVHDPDVLVVDEMSGDFIDKEKYIEQILSMKSDAYGYLIQTNALGKELEFSTKIEMVSATGVVNTIDITSEADSRMEINLLLDSSGRGGGDAHYFILYNDSQYRQLSEKSTSLGMRK